MSGVDKLLEVLKNISQRKERVQSKQELSRSKQQLRDQVLKNQKPHWRYNSSFGKKMELNPLRNRCLDNWEILRINLSDRSYQKNYKAIKIPAKGSEFVKYDSKDKDGHLPYLYEADYPKINKIQSNFCESSIKKINTVQSKLFGLKQQKNDRGHRTTRFSRISNFQI